MTELEATRAELESRNEQLSRQNAGLAVMARELEFVSAECARLRSDLDLEREQSAVFVKEIERLRAVEAGAAVMRTVLNEIGRHREWAHAVGQALAGGAGKAFLARHLAAESDLFEAQQKIRELHEDRSQVLNGWTAEVKELHAEVERLRSAK